MNPSVPSLLKPRRHYGRWVLFGLLVMATPVVILAIGVASMLTLNRDAAVLRREIMAATDAGWHTKVQMSVGGIVLGAVRTGLQFVQAEHMDEARLALAAVRRASVGVYESNVRNTNIGFGALLGRADKIMNRRGWTRLVGVAEEDKTVLVYSSDEANADGRLDLCVAVVDRNQLVVVSTTVNADALLKLVELHAPKDVWKNKLKLAKV
ncbi:MAG TPA: hypothetical protein VIM71_02060 [Lacunisphaera sp.]